MEEKFQRQKKPGRKPDTINRKEHPTDHNNQPTEPFSFSSFHPPCCVLIFFGFFVVVVVWTQDQKDPKKNLRVLFWSKENIIKGKRRRKFICQIFVCVCVLVLLCCCADGEIVGQLWLVPFVPPPAAGVRPFFDGIITY